MKFNFIDSAIALNLAFFVNVAILILAASAFYANGFNAIGDIQHAYVLLNNLFGNYAPTLFAIALIAAGQSSTITGTLAGQIVMEGYLNLRISPWIRRLLTRTIAIIPTLFTILYFGEKSLGQLLILSQVILSMQLGFAVIPLIHFTSSKKIMGDFKIKTIVKILSWITAIIILSLNVNLVIEETKNFFNYLGDENLFIKTVTSLAICFAASLLVYITFEPFIHRSRKEKSFVPHGEAIELSKIQNSVYKKIALTVDFTKHDEATIQHALSLGGLKANYLLLHVVESAGAIRMKSEVMDMETEYDKQNLEKYKLDLTGLGYDVDVELGFGKSANVISEIINTKHIDLLVMGSHGHKGINDIIFGTTVDKVRHNVNVPVLIVK